MSKAQCPIVVYHLAADPIANGVRLGENERMGTTIRNNGVQTGLWVLWVMSCDVIVVDKSK